MDLFYRLAHIETKQGLWYDMEGVFTGLIYADFKYCKASEMLMPFNPEITGFLSAVTSLDDLFKLFPHEDIIKLQEYGYHIHIYKSKNAKYVDWHWLIDSEKCTLFSTMLLFS